MDYCRYSMNGNRATDIDWIFFHYGPWAYAMPDLMEAVMDYYPFGWQDRSEEFGDRMPSFDPAEKLEFPVEQLMSKIINAFRMKDTNTLIEWCYKQTEPMLNAKRGDPLDFSKIEITGNMPEFFPTQTTSTMPQIPAAVAAKRDQFRARLRNRQEQYRQWKDDLASPEYMEALRLVAEENEAYIPDLSKTRVFLTKEAVDELGKGDDER